MKYVILSVMAALAACSSGGGSTDQSPAPAALVKLAPAQRGSVAETVDIYGSAQNDANNQGILSAPAEAIVAQIVIPEGSPVRRGQVVLRLSPSPATRLEIANAASAATAAQQALARARRLRADGLVSDAEVESARAAAQSSSATASSLSSRAGALALRAPVSGYVQPFPVSPGDLVTAGTQVASIARDGDLRGRFGIDPELARRVAPGASLRILGPDNGPPLTVPVLSVDPVVNPQTRLAAIFVSIPASANIGAGESLRGQVVLSSVNDVLTVPYAALLDDGGQPYVYSVENGVTHRRDIVVGAISNDRVAILSGLPNGAQVVVEGGTALEDGMTVRTQ